MADQSAPKISFLTAVTTGPNGEDHVYAIDDSGRAWRITVKGNAPVTGWSRLPSLPALPSD
jgi:hypothetical protein